MTDITDEPIFYWHDGHGATFPVDIADYDEAADCPHCKPVYSAETVDRLRARVAELETVEAAARVYYEHYMQDEAADEDYCICGLDQHERAKAVRDSLRKAKDGAPEHPAYTAPPAPPVDVDAAIDAAKDGA